MKHFEIGVLMWIMTMFLLVVIAPMAVNIWFFMQETKQRKKEIESKKTINLLIILK